MKLRLIVNALLIPVLVFTLPACTNQERVGNIRVDITPPQITVDYPTEPQLTIDYPTEGITLTNRDQIYYKLSCAEGFSGINPETLEILLNDKNITRVFDKTLINGNYHFDYHPRFDTMEGLGKWRRVHWASSDGANELRVKIANNAGNVLEEIRHFAITQETIHIPTASAHHHKAWFEPEEWDTIHIKAVETPTPTPYQPVKIASSTVTVTATTQGTFTLSYTDISGVSIKVKRIIEIDNITRVISYKDSTVTLLKDIFEPLPSPLGQETVTLFMGFSHWVTIFLGRQ